MNEKYPLPLAREIKQLNLREIKDFLNAKVSIKSELFNDNRVISCVSTLNNLQNSSFIFLDKALDCEDIKRLNSSNVGLVISRPQVSYNFLFNHILTRQVRLSHVLLTEELYNYKSDILSAVNDVERHRNGSNISIGDHTFIGKNVQIGKGTIIQSNVSIGPNCIIGSDVIIKSGTRIGFAGFGHVKQDSVAIHVPHVGGVIIGDRVEFGCNNNVSSGTIHPTRVGDDVKTGDLVHIAHNVRVGHRTLIAPCASVSGSTVIGDDCFIGANSAIRDGTSLVNDVFIGIGSVVIKNCEVSGTYFGSPARLKT